MTLTTPFTSSIPVRPSYDPELVPVLQAMRSVLPRLSSDTLEEVRKLSVKDGFPGRPSPDLTAGGKVRVDERTIPGPAQEMNLIVLTPTVGTGPWPLLYCVHGGGMVAGDRYFALDEVLPYVEEGKAVVASIEYRLAPEHPHPAPVEDCYAGLCWVAQNADLLGIDPDHIIAMGFSAGGGLVAAIALMARDKGFPALSHQILGCPMLDDRLRTQSAQMLDGEGVFDRNENLFGWTALLGDRRGTDEVSPYAAPARAQDLSGLPRTYIDVGSVEGFRDEAIDFAQRLSQAGVSVDLHMWGGGFHGFDIGVRQPAICQTSIAVRDAFIRRALER
ncbi:alpha/beta hydrolase [Nocardia cyriacigeorgica]|uniref:alpha/beta hydrolase n=1 Tax=Nocardia cyriacigeorgica TaxID=135487 RepID=UPI0013D6A515|nr:alpha/beta hydrolase [Nocardia cyriacigeorgica]NEW27070.1 alpha/beta hydrolase [Nocardia cyriacigeorgica]